MRTRNLAIGLALVGLLAAAGTAAVFLRQPTGQIANVYVDGVCVQSIDLSGAAGQAVVQGPIGENVIEYGGGHLRVTRADCPDGVCIAHGDLTSRSDPIVCLPNRVVIRLEREAALDAVAR